MFNHTKIYTVHIRPETDPAFVMPVFVREGFNIWAFALGFFWAIYNRAWHGALLIAAIDMFVLYGAHTKLLAPQSLWLLQFTVLLIAGFHGGDWLRASLKRRGYITADIVTSDNLIRAEQRFFERQIST